MVEWIHWHTEPALLIGILTIVWIYFVLVGPYRDRIDPSAGWPKREVWFFVLAVLSFYGAVGSPLDALGENFLFSAHMVQHNILMYITAPLTLLALPLWLVDGLFRQFPKLERICAFVFHPLVAGFSFTFVFCIWHFPVLYEAALHDKFWHMVEHLTMYLTSVQMFWVVMGPSARVGRSPWGVQILYVFLLMVAQIPLFGILTFSPEVLYPTYELAPRVTFLDPQSDQVLGGLLMKVANMIISLWLMGRAFVLWNREAEQITPRASIRPSLAG